MVNPKINNNRKLSSYSRHKTIKKSLYIGIFVYDDGKMHRHTTIKKTAIYSYFFE